VWVVALVRRCAQASEMKRMNGMCDRSIKLNSLQVHWALDEYALEWIGTAGEARDRYSLLG